MFEKWKSILTVGLLSAFVLGFGIWAAVKPADALSTSERRPLAQMPELSASSYLSGKFMSGYEDYATDQFPLREQFRTLKALMGLYVFGQKDNNGVYLADGSAAKLEYPLNEGSVAHAADRFRYLYETLMAGTDAKVYLSVIPDKNYFLAEANGYPALDYQALTDALRKQTEFAAYIDLFGTLTADDYYRTEGWIEDFMEGYRDLSAQYDVGLVGGDTTASDSGLVVNVTAIGRIADSHIKRRSDARPGDLIAVGGSLGESGAGLRDILAGRYDTPLAQIHRNPAPQVAEGIWLGERPEVHAMMDISDGIASDLRHILHQSGVGAEVDTECIPTPVDLETAVSGGEDYKLLFTVAPESANTLLSNYRLRFGDEFHFIGRITGGNHLEWLRNGTPLPVDWQGFRHY